MRKLAEEALMIGEVGLDRLNARNKECIPFQKPLFEVFLEVAEKQDKIMNLHFRGTDKEGYEMLQSYNIKRDFFHGYIGSLKYMDDISI